MSDVPLRPKRKIRTCEEEGGKTTEAWSTIVMRWLVCVCVCVCVRYMNSCLYYNYIPHMLLLLRIVFYFLK